MTPRLKIDIHAHEFPQPYLDEILRLAAKGKFPSPVIDLNPWSIDENLAPRFNSLRPSTTRVRWWRISTPKDFRS